MKKFAWPSIAAIIFIFVGLAHESWVTCGADIDIGAEQAGKIPLAAIVAKLGEEGYTTVEEVELEDGYYEIEGRKADGSEFEIYVDPATGEIVEYVDDDDEDQGDGDDDDDEDDDDS